MPSVLNFKINLSARFLIRMVKELRFWLILQCWSKITNEITNLYIVTFLPFNKNGDSALQIGNLLFFTLNRSKLYLLLNTAKTKPLYTFLVFNADINALQTLNLVMKLPFTNFKLQQPSKCSNKNYSLEFTSRYTVILFRGW